MLSQSKLTQEQLTELQQATLFERKELQQWYKGTFIRFNRDDIGSGANRRI
jgi:hypothetical protein